MTTNDERAMRAFREPAIDMGSAEGSMGDLGDLTGLAEAVEDGYREAEVLRLTPATVIGHVM